METKHSYESKGVVGGALAAFVSLALLVKMFWPEVIDDETIERAKDPATVEAFMLLIGFGSGILAVFGRIFAKKSIVPFLLIGIMALGLAGCDVLTAEQRMHLNEATLEVNVLNERCQAGDNEACRLGLEAAAMYLNSLQGGE